MENRATVCRFVMYEDDTENVEGYQVFLKFLDRCKESGNRHHRILAFDDNFNPRLR